MKRDPYKHQEKYLAWKERIDEVGHIEEISKKNSDLILKYIFDMELGMNVSRKSAKGSRSYIRLNNLKQRMIFLSKRLEEYYTLSCLKDLTEHQVISFFSKMRSGEIKRVDGGEYKSVVDFVKIFKAFWHWHIKVSKKQGIEILDITEDLDCSKNKPQWVYLNEQQVRHLCENAKYNYKVLIMFLFDSGIRSPTELINIKVSDFLKDYKELNIRDEVSKTFGRRIKMMMCSSLIKEYIQAKNLSSEDYLFDITPCVVNRYLKRLSKKLFGEGNSLAGQKYSDLTMYDFRHISCCYWLPRYKSESALKFRFGWKKSDKIHYYSEMLGMKDTISEEDMLIDITKTELEQRVTKTENEKEVLNERLQALEKQMGEILGLVKRGELVIPLINI
jgi:integrase